MAEDKKNNVKMAVLNEPKSENPRGSAILKEAAAADGAPGVVSEPADAAKKQDGWLISSIDHPEDVVYGKENIHMSPRAQLHINDVSLLPSQLPAGISLKVKK